MKKYIIIFLLKLLKFIDKKNTYIIYNESPFYINARQSGNSTRLIDKHIQTLFNTGKCVTYDHYGTRQASIRLLELTLSRLMYEHGLTPKKLKVDRSGLSIMLNNNVK